VVVDELAIREVLLPLDGSAFALAALPTARALAERLGAELSTISLANNARDARRLEQDATAALGRGNGTVHVVRGDDPAAAIGDRAAVLESCVVCMSTRGRGRVAGAVIGSVARAVLESTSAPVIAVGPEADRPPFLVGRPRRRPRHWPAPLSIPRLVACVDGSHTSEMVLPAAAAWSRALDMQLAIVTVAEPAAGGAGGTGPNRYGPPDPEQYVERLTADWRQHDAAVVGTVVRDPLGVEAGLAAHLRAHPAGLIALATRALTGLPRIRLGAAGADIVRRVPVPALIVHAGVE
jgi:nucleotide-binding universal stress UspA family protein